MNAQGSSGGTDHVAHRPDAAALEQEVARLPEVLYSRLTEGEEGLFVAARVVARRGSFLERVARDVQSVIAVVSAVEIPLDQIEVVDEAGPEDVPGTDHKSAVSPWHEKQAEAAVGDAAGEVRGPPPLDAAAARLLERAVRPRSSGGTRASAGTAPAWGELLVRSPPLGGRVTRGASAIPGSNLLGGHGALSGDGAAGERGGDWPPTAAGGAASLRRDIFVKPSDSRGALARWLRFLR